MLNDARELPAGAEPRAQACVIGTGAAGVSVALELARSGVGVLLLEAGGRRADRAGEDQLRAVIPAGTPHEPLELLSRRRLGGTTQIWGGRCAPLDALDLEARDWVPGSGWPLTAAALDPLYRRAQEWCEAGEYSYGAPEALGAGGLFGADDGSALDDTALWRYSPPVDFWRRHRRELVGSPQVTVLEHACVGRLERDLVSGRIEAAVISLPDRELRARAELYVIATGGLQTARLLLASNRESPAGVGNEHDLVGRFYGTHLVGEAGAVGVDPATAAAGGLYGRARDGVWSLRRFALTPTVQRQERLRNTVLGLRHPDPRDPAHRDALLSSFALARGSLARLRLDWKSRGVKSEFARLPGTRQHLGNVARGIPAVASFGATWTRQRLLARRRIPGFAAVPGAIPLRLRIDAEQTPDRENRASLSRERDPLGVPRLELRFRIGDEDRASIQRSLELACAEIERLRPGSVAAAPGREELAELVSADGTHQIGVARMGESPRTGVVDPDCRVHGAANLYVAGSATFPTTGAVAPTLTLVALALRVADSARADLGA